jgi:predicted trehalose synthase
VQARLDAVRARSAYALLPAEYRAIDQATQVTRADLAALVGIRLGKLLQSGQRGTVAVITDVRNNWAAPWIMAVTRAGVLSTANGNAFQPSRAVTGAEAIDAISKLEALSGRP